MSASELLMSLEMGLIYGIIAIGIYLTFRIINFPDLTCDGSFVLGAAASSVLVKAGYNPFLGLLVASLAGSLAGLGTGILNTRFKVTDLLSGILVAFMLYSVNLKIMSAPNIAMVTERTAFADGETLMILIIICFIIALSIGYLLTTDFGLGLRGIAFNKRLAQNGGVSIKAMIVIGLALSNSLIALGGALFSQSQRFADISSGTGTIVIGLASVMIGERILPYRSLLVQLVSCLIGSILYRLFISLALHSDILGLETQDLNLITGLLIIAVMVTKRRSAC
ncbi:MAG: hypothetical protein V4485_06150 [Pseudomonadota bacterium]